MTPDVSAKRNWHPDFDSAWLTSSSRDAELVVLHQGDDPPNHVWGSVLLLGNFDGLHIGHRRLLAAARREAALRRAPLGIMSCEPHPKDFFNPGGTPFRLSGPKAKRLLCARLGINLLFMPKFDAEFASYSANGFMADVLVGQLGVRAVVVGEDFRFGNARAGGVADLRDAETWAEFDTIVVPELNVDGTRISSTAVRQWIASGQIEKARAAVGDGWLISAQLSGGDQVNLDGRALLPPPGKYQVTLWEENGRALSTTTMMVLPGRIVKAVDCRHRGDVLISDWLLLE